MPMRITLVATKVLEPFLPRQWLGNLSPNPLYMTMPAQILSLFFCLTRILIFLANCSSFFHPDLRCTFLFFDNCYL